MSTEETEIGSEVSRADTWKPYVVSWLYEGNRFWTSCETREKADQRMDKLRADDASEVLLEVNLGSNITDRLPGGGSSDG